MHNVQLGDNLYREAERRAKEAGFESVDAFVADVVSLNLHDDPDNFDHLFTPERIAELERISAEMKAGGPTYTPQQVRAHLDEVREAWIKDHQD
jgi:hypothetical protein